MRARVGVFVLALMVSLSVAGPAWAEVSITTGGPDGNFAVSGTDRGSSGGKAQPGSGSGSQGRSGNQAERGRSGSSQTSGSGGASGRQGGSSNSGDSSVPICIGVCDERPLWEDPIPTAGGGAAVAPTPEQVRTWAVSAATSVRLPVPAIGIDPDPSVNKWRIVAVGQPLWLYDSAATVVSSAASNQGITVSIRATRVAVAFDMQEKVVRCTAMTRRPSTADPRAKSPTCGYVYQRKGDRTVRATASWQISWAAQGQSGTVAMTRASTRQLPVRELLAVNVRPNS